MQIPLSHQSKDLLLHCAGIFQQVGIHAQHRPPEPVRPVGFSQIFRPVPAAPVHHAVLHDADLELLQGEVEDHHDRPELIVECDLGLHRRHNLLDDQPQCGFGFRVRAVVRKLAQPGEPTSVERVPCGCGNGRVADSGSSESVNDLDGADGVVGKPRNRVNEPGGKSICCRQRMRAWWGAMVAPWRVMPVKGPVTAGCRGFDGAVFFRCRRIIRAS